MVVKLEIKVLPCVITFIDGVTRDKCVSRLTADRFMSPPEEMLIARPNPASRIVGFEGVGDGQSDDFTTGQLELRLSQSESIAAKPGHQDGAIRRPF